MTDIMRSDWVPRYQDAGYDQLVDDITTKYAQLSIDNLTFLLNYSGELHDLTSDLTLIMLQDLYINGLISMVLLEGAPISGGTNRQDAPAGFGQDGSSVWFSTPSTGTYDILWYVNGALTLTQEDQDVSSSRSASKASLGTEVDDIVQVAIVDENVVGWWGRVTIT